ncbi:hypothetical protein GQ55_6G213100 [Panicum hallii var. hallii]|uniref:Uncharacterized protein n=1 Tax=Panicum hallii var. hallii TaxID=1504633 RepID=A0A2T7D830_9POAL|nr:hypothetical protein GQ55_6G213100 [Panicum hallii var. hallii]
MGVQEPPRPSSRSGVGSFPRAAPASGTMNRHDPRRRSPQTATVAAASIRSRLRRRIRAHARRHLRGDSPNPSGSSRPLPCPPTISTRPGAFVLVWIPTCSASCSLGSKSAGVN